MARVYSHRRRQAAAQAALHPCPILPPGAASDPSDITGRQHDIVAIAFSSDGIIAYQSAFVQILPGFLAAAAGLPRISLPLPFVERPIAQDLPPSALHGALNAPGPPRAARAPGNIFPSANHATLADSFSRSFPLPNCIRLGIIPAQAVLQAPARSLCPAAPSGAGRAHGAPHKLGESSLRGKADRCAQAQAPAFH